MVSMRVLEREGVIQPIDRDHINWERIRTSVLSTLRQRGFDVDRAEELAQAAIVNVYAANEMISSKRAAADCMAEAYGILHREAAERSTSGGSLLDGDTVEQSRHVEQRTSYETTTADVRNGLKALRDTRMLCRHYGVTEDGISFAEVFTVDQLADCQPHKHGRIVVQTETYGSCFHV